MQFLSASSPVPESPRHAFRHRGRAHHQQCPLSLDLVRFPLEECEPGHKSTVDAICDDLAYIRKQSILQLLSASLVCRVPKRHVLACLGRAHWDAILHKPFHDQHARSARNSRNETAKEPR